MRCDSHVHIVGAAESYPQIATRTYLAGPAPLDALRRRAATRGVERFVIVQPSFYGADNALLLESLDVLGAHGRGVVVIDPATTGRDTLADFARRGVRGVRLNFYSTRPAREFRRLDDVFAATANLVRAVGWHVEVIAPIGLLADNADVLARSPVPVVIDHYGLHGRSRPESGEGRRLLDLLRLAHVWMKLSAPYRVSDDPLHTRPDTAWLAAILACAKDRCIWGSDWPHTPAHDLQTDNPALLPYRNLSYAALADDFLGALAPGLADRIMIDNPARLYGFEGSA